MLIHKNTLRNEAVTFAPLPCPPPVMAGGRREAADPIGAPIRRRNISKRTTGTIGNGCAVRVLRNGADDAGRAWAYVKTLDGHTIGWVYRELINWD